MALDFNYPYGDKNKYDLSGFDRHTVSVTITCHVEPGQGKPDPKELKKYLQETANRYSDFGFIEVNGVE